MVKYIERLKLNYRIYKFKKDCEIRVRNTLSIKYPDWKDFNKMVLAGRIADEMNEIKYILIFGSDKDAQNRLYNYRDRIKNIQELGKELNNR